jgi:hypothetical protein
MKIKLCLFVCLLWSLSAGYSQDVLSLHPLFTEQDAVLISGIEGTWDIPAFDMTVSFQRAGDNFYLVKYGSVNNPSTFEAVFVKIRDEVYLDLTGIMSDTLGDEDYRSSFLNTHTFYKIRMSKDTLLLYDPSYTWFYNQAKINQSQLRVEWVRNAMLLTNNTDELKTFFSANGMAEKAFNDPLILVKVHSDIKAEKHGDKHDSGAYLPTGIKQPCHPAFPLKDGWLGGDGTVSVPISPTSTLFIFSDTWVGHEKQYSRMEEGMKMVSNSAAIVTCLPDGESKTEYFWNNKYSENPEPLFKTYTTRYIYWVPDAFMFHGTLYVLLEKVGPKPGTLPTENFNFLLMGYTLARIDNPADTPDKWNITYIPLPDFRNPTLAIGAHAKLENHIYFFINLHDQAQALVRKQYDLLDNTEIPFEYYALDKTWKEGLNIHDMDTVVNGFRSTTVNYHTEMKQWVMICDIKFMQNKIKMRTAPALTGPWSEETEIYEIPEVTPGSSSYNESNFCYLPRECIQNYDPGRQMMLLTYDINNQNISDIIANPGIYTPKVITVRLKEPGNR